MMTIAGRRRASTRRGSKAAVDHRVLSEHAFDKLRLIDCSIREFEIACEGAEVIGTADLERGEKELLLTVGWVRPRHAVVIVDQAREEDRILTIYEPDRAVWAADFKTTR